jgi:cobalt-zinc-cadmium efflux system outer membrane protein
LEIIRKLACGMAVGAALWPSFTGAQGVSLAQAVEAAWRRAVASAEATGQVRRADADRRAALALWAAPPSLELSHRDDRWQTDRGARETEIGVAVPLWLPGQRAARQGAAEADRAAATASVEAGRHRVAGVVREAAWEVALQQSEVALAEAQSEAAGRLADDVERRIAAGDLGRADGLAARSEQLAAATALSQARQRLQAAVLSWTALTGLTDVADPLTDRGSPGPADEHPALRAARLHVEGARRRLESVRVSRSSPPELTASVRQEVPGRGDPTTNSLGLGIRVPFGTPDRNEPLLAAALTDAEVAEAQERQIRVHLEAEIETARAAERAAAQQLTAEKDRARALRERAELVERSFQAGETPLPETLTAVLAAQQAEASARRHEAALGLARARLLQAQGITP